MLLKKDKMFFTEPMFRLASLIFNRPNTSFHLRKICRETGLSTTSASEAIKRLEKLSVIKVDKTEFIIRVMADLDSKSYIGYKQSMNIYRLRKDKMIESLADEYGNPESITLFGSFARGEDIEESDIDILIVGSTKPKSSFVEESMEKEFRRKINIHHMDSLDRCSKDFLNAIANGITLHGYLQVVR